MRVGKLYRYIALFFISWTLSIVVSGRDGEVYKGYYRSPMNIPMLLSANFGETRTNHFHSGLDIKTGGQEGEPIYAVADGHISRIGVMPSGFGRVLYVNHPNGTTSVYAHMQWFNKELEGYVSAERYNQKKHRIDLYVKSDKFPVTKGQFLGYSGNSGASFGPHLHFELRNTASQRPMNILKLGIYDVKDDIRPRIEGLYYIEVDTINNVPIHSSPRPLKVKNVFDGEYVLADTSILEVAPKGYFVLEVTDRKNNTHNTMGVYAVKAELDGEIYFSFQINGFLFSETRYVNSLNHYALQRNSRNELLRLAVQDANKLSVYSGVRHRGLIILDDDQPHKIRITAEDDNGNMSIISFVIKKTGAQKIKSTSSETVGIPIDNRRSYSRSGGGIDVTIPVGALYEPIFYTQSVDSLDVRGVDKNTRVTRYSQVYAVHDEDIPIHTNIGIAIITDNVPDKLLGKLCLAKVGSDGRLSYAGGAYQNGKVSAEVRTFGKYCVVADTLPPSVAASFVNNAKLSTAKSISFTLKDDFSGISYFNASIDGQWIPFEQKGNKITHWFDKGQVAYKGTEHKLVLNVTDHKGNSTLFERSFIR